MIGLSANVKDMVAVSFPEVSSKLEIQCKKACIFHLTLAGILSILMMLSIKSSGQGRGFLNGKNLLNMTKVICQQST